MKKRLSKIFKKYNTYKINLNEINSILVNTI